MDLVLIRAVRSRKLRDLTRTVKVTGGKAKVAILVERAPLYVVNPKFPIRFGCKQRSVAREKTIAGRKAKTATFLNEAPPYITIPRFPVKFGQRPERI